MQTHGEHIVNADWKLCNRVGSPWVYQGSQHKPSGVAGNYLKTAEPWCANSINDQFIIINVNVPKAPQKAKILMRMLAANANTTQTEGERTRGALP